MANNRMEQSRVNRSRSDRQKQRHRRKRWIQITLLSFLFLFTLVGVFLYQVWGTMTQTYHPYQTDKREKAVTLNEPFSILLLGADSRDATSNWRPDVILLAAINPSKHTVRIVSIPRDTYVPIANTGGEYHKINSAAYFGRKKVNPNGPGSIKNTAETVEHVLNVPIDYYIKVNFKGFTDVVDALGGVDVNVKFPFKQAMIGGKIASFKPGPKHLNGSEALAYVRMRKGDTQGDAGRNLRQQEVITQLLDSAVSLNSITKVGDLLDSVGNNLSMSISPKDALRLQSIYRKIPKEQIQSERLQGENRRLKLWYFFVKDSERQRVSDLFRTQLGLKKEPVQPFHTKSEE
ncbi:LCP family protein [Marininema halotolerans]|uniref:Cell envelope-related function transcriptional attenuator common domain-containing protein n=1 Tax=Marininema halotolerans TaxID=1155944 RepID=A0A1I6P080_9BACL|nr:LCP family protein [Marininema halotolerans]SFS33626.1 cell envelope-related function transcriptional attenuator common domain-containing protein [Marininema halotolerans]